MTQEKLQEEIDLAERQLQEVQACLEDCEKRHAETGMEFYRIHAATDRMGVEFWTSQLDYLHKQTLTSPTRRAYDH